ncbi:response regulator transcription factor [Flavobacterium alkalisoli]|uniref:Response regulator transcription factor n=1 Tax=Flavobacterium alkalisoli TaxID=2602769 RepID=A0A5B9FV75_9FLAO|nr:response regulator transcription factor [Flavobacterium alkalisoli]QEE50834.1 response regulator transcription factor [Flavobacterium alkalisoli]
MKDILIAITDDDNLIAQLLESYLSTCPNLKVLFTANSGLDLIEKLKTTTTLPDILLLDLKMEGMDGVETTQYIKANHPEIKIIVISSHYQNSFLGFLFKTGASAFVPKGISPVLLKEIITRVHETGIYFMDDQIDSMREQISSKSPKPDLNDENDLSEREIDVLKLICMQKTAKEIGETLFITTRTVEGHKNNLFAKTGAKNIAGLVIYAVQHNIINIHDLNL